MVEISIEIEKELNTILNKYIADEGNIISILQDIEETLGYIPEDAVNWFSKKLDIPASRFFGVATFYAQFHLKPRGKNIITVCCGTACYVKRSEDILDKIKTNLKINVGEVTEDRRFSLEAVRCLGACGLAPVMVINHDIYGAVNPRLIKGILNKYKQKSDSE